MKKIVEEENGKNKIFSKILDGLLTVFQSIIIFVITFLVIVTILFFITPGNPKDKFADAKEYFMAAIGKPNTEVEIEENPLDGVEENKVVSLDTEDESDTIQPSISRQVEPSVEQIEVEMQNQNSNLQNVGNIANSLYYMQLDEYGKIIYDKLSMESAYFLNGTHSFNYGTVFDNLLNTENGAQILEHSFQAAVNAFALDFPQLYFVDVSNISLVITQTKYMGTKPVYKVKIENAKGKSFYADGIRSREELDMIRAKVEEIRGEIIANALKYNTQYEQIMYVHDYIVDNVYYDDTIQDSTKYNLAFTLLRGGAVCEGYAKLFKYIMDGMNIPTVTVVGFGINSAGNRERHAWNQVYIDGNWYGLDTTWDDPVIIGNGFLTKKQKYKYFLVGQNVFNGNHIPNGNVSDGVEFSYPELSVTSYEPALRVVR